MSIREDLELLDQTQHELEFLGEELEETHGIDRRDFVFWSLVTAAASTFGFGAQRTRDRRRPPRRGGDAPQAAPLPPLGNGEPVSWTFQPYHEGTGALMEKLINERGAAAFQRATFVVEPWTGKVPTDPNEIAFLPAHRLSALIKAPSHHVDAAHADLSRPHQAARSDAALRRDDHGRPGDGRSGKGRRRPQGGQVSRPAARHPVRREGPLLGEGRAHDVGLEGFRESHHRRRRRGRRAAAQRGRGAHRQARDRTLRAGRPVVSRTHEQPVGHSPRLERIVGRPRVGDGGGLRRVRHRHGDVGLDRVTVARVRTQLAASDVRPRDAGTAEWCWRGRRIASARSAARSKIARWCSTRSTASIRRIRARSRRRSTSTATSSSRRCASASTRTRRRNSSTSCASSARRRRRSPRVRSGGGGGGGLGVESSAAFDSYVQWKAKELGIDLATIPEPQGRGGFGGGGGGGGAVVDAARREIRRRSRARRCSR